LRRHPAETVSSRTGVPPRRGRPPERQRFPVVMPTQPRPHARGRRDRGDSSGNPADLDRISARSNQARHREGIAERGRVGGSRPRSAERGKGKAATAAAGRVGCAATYRDLATWSTGLAALLDHRTAAMPGRFEERSSWPGRPGVRSAERGEREGDYRPCAGNRQIETGRHCRRVRLASRPRLAPDVGTHAPGPAVRFRPFPSTSRLWRCWLGGTTGLLWLPGRPFPTRAHARSRRDRPCQVPLDCWWSRFPGHKVTTG
jgi:hypothetical protein